MKLKDLLVETIEEISDGAQALIDAGREGDVAHNGGFTYDPDSEEVCEECMTHRKPIVVSLEEWDSDAGMCVDCRQAHEEQDEEEDDR